MLGMGMGVGMGVGASPAPGDPTMTLDFVNSNTLDPRVTFTRASAASYTDSSGTLQTAAADGPRFDYDPVTLACKGLLIEEQRTNLHTFSEQVDLWGTPSNASVSSNAANSPDNSITADLLVENTVNGQHFLSAAAVSVSYVSGVQYTRSCYIKAYGKKLATVYLPASNFASTGRQASFDLVAGTIYAVESGVTAAIQKVNNEWYRCVVTATATVNGVGHVGGSALLSNAGEAVYTGDGTSGIYIWGAQLEAGAFPTSYIPTTTTALTRAADVATMTGANFSDWYNQTEGTLYGDVQFNSPSLGANRYFSAFDDGTTNNLITMYCNTSDRNTVGFVVVNASGVYQQGAGLTPTSGLAKLAISYKQASFIAGLNGVLASETTAGNVPTVIKFVLGNRSDGLRSINGHISRISYYPRRLSNSQLQTITG